MSNWRETDFGRIPKKWSLKRVIDIKSQDKRAIAMGPFGSNIKAENFVDKGVPVIRGTNLNYSRYVGGKFVYLTEEKANKLIGSNCKPGDLVFTHRGTIGQVGLIPEGRYPNYVISQSGMKLSVDSNIVDHHFLFYFFKSSLGQFQLLKYESQVGVPSISNPLTSLKEIEVPIPPLPEQKSIAEVLSSLDDKIDLLHRQNKTLEAMAEALFRQWFVVEAKEDWEEGTLGDLGTVVTGKTPSKNNPEYWGNKHPFITPTDYKNFGKFSFYPERYLSQDGWEVMKRIQLPKNSIMVTCIGSDMGKVAIASSPCITNQQINSIILRDEKYLEYIYQFLKYNYPLLRNMAFGGTTMPIINKSDFEKIGIPIPEDSSVIKYQNLTTPLSKKIYKNHNQIYTLKKLRDSLLPKLMSGEVTIKNSSH